MAFVRRIAVRCGIAGGILALVGAVFLASLFSAHLSVAALVKFAWYFVSLSIITLTGVAALVGIMIRRKRPRLAAAVLWITGLAIAIVSLWVDPKVLGIVFAPAYVLLIISALGLTPTHASGA